MAEGLSLEVLDDTRKLAREELEWITRHAHAACERLGAGGEVRVRVILDAAMAEAHEMYADVPGTTDVLTFDLRDPEESPGPEHPVTLEGREGAPGEDSERFVYGLDTDILVCLDEAERQAASRGYARKRELLLYVVHGVLHCLGHDDHAPEAAELMHATEDSVLRAIGVGAVYGGGRDGGAGDTA